MNNYNNNNGNNSKNNNCNHLCNHFHINNINRCHGGNLRKGPTSFHLFDQNLLFENISIKKGDRFLDCGCGNGDYAFKALQSVGENGFVYAVDIQKKAIEAITAEIEKLKIKNMKAITADITIYLPLDDNAVDICFISTVLHALNIKKSGDKLFKEIARVLKPGGRLISIDCKKEPSDFGPPLDIRISAEELNEIVSKHGFNIIKSLDLGHFYMSFYTK